MNKETWIENIPEGWEIVPLKSRFSFSKGLSITKADLVEEGLPVLSYGQIHSKLNSGTKVVDALLRYVPEEIAMTSPDSLAEPGGFVFADTSEDLEGCGNCSYVDRPGIYGGYHTIVLKPNSTYKTDNRYLAYLFQTDAWRFQLRRKLTEVKVFSVSQKALKETGILVPSAEEQQAIVSFLDSKCAAIDEAIERHKKKSEKLEEYRCSIISDYMTRTAGVKTRIKFVGSVQTGPFGTQLSASEYVDDGTPCINVKNIKNGYISEENVDKVPLSVIQRLPTHVLLTGDIVFARKGSIDKHAIVSENENGWLQGSDCIRLRLKSMYNSEYVNYNLSSQYVKDYLLTVANGSTMPSLNSDMIKELPIIIHDISEQQKIVAELNVVTQKIDQALHTSMGIVSKLQDYRKSLIYHVVTGIIDCREAV